MNVALGSVVRPGRRRSSRDTRRWHASARTKLSPRLVQAVWQVCRARDTSLYRDVAINSAAPRRRERSRSLGAFQPRRAGAWGGDALLVRTEVCTFRPFARGSGRPYSSALCCRTPDECERRGYLTDFLASSSWNVTFFSERVSTIGVVDRTRQLDAGGSSRRIRSRRRGRAPRRP